MVRLPFDPIVGSVGSTLCGDNGAPTYGPSPFLGFGTSVTSAATTRIRTQQLRYTTASLYSLSANRITVYFIGTRLVYIWHWDLWPTCEGTPITFIFSHKTCVAFSCYLCYVLGCLMGAATVTGSNNWAVTKAPCFALPPDLCRIHSWELNKRAEVRLISHRHPSWARKLQMVSAKWQYPLRSTGPSTVVLIAAGRDHQSTILINVHTCGKGRCLML